LIAGSSSESSIEFSGAPQRRIMVVYEYYSPSAGAGIDGHKYVFTERVKRRNAPEGD
jgi:hypothetical protein